MTALVVGIFVGGRGLRLGGVVKGLLTAPNSQTSLVERLLGELRVAVPASPVVLVGNAEAYAGLGLPAVSDNPPGVGPLGGLLGLLEFAGQREARFALALACDLPRAGSGVLARLAAEMPDAGALVTEQSGVRNPLIARYAVEPALAAAREALGAGARSLQAVLDCLHVATLPLNLAEEASLADWDTPADMR